MNNKTNNKMNNKMFTRKNRDINKDNDRDINRDNDRDINMDIKSEIGILERALNRTMLELGELRMLVPQGVRLHAQKHGNVYQYYLRKEKTDLSGSYLKSEDRSIAIMLAQIEYDEKLIVILERNLNSLRKLEKSWINNTYENTFAKMTPGKRKLVKLPYLSDEDYIKNWLAKGYEGVDFKEDAPEYYTKRGLRVRSKSEVIIADILDDMSIPFLYEKPLMLKAGTVHPDFTLLNIKDRKEVYWEHFGMMDDMEYRNNAFYKIRSYESSGFYQYESVIWTFETERYPLNIKGIRDMIKELKGRLGY